MIFSIEEIEKAARSTFDVVVGNHPDKTSESGEVIKGEPVGFRVLGPGSDEYQAAERSIQLLNVKEASIRKELIDGATDEGAALIVDGATKRRDLLLKACVTGWFGFPDEFTQENMARVFKARPAWARLVSAAIDDEGNFAKG